jgi:hypothetical protein
MIVSAKIVIFLLGMSLCVQMISALYGFIDLGYTSRSAWIAVCRRLLIWIIAAVVFWRLLGEVLRPSFLWGMIGYVFLYILIFGSYHLVFAWNTKSMKTK